MKVKWELYLRYLCVLVFSVVSVMCSAQITAKHFNAEWNSANSVSWFMELKECNTKGLTDINSLMRQKNIK